MAGIGIVQREFLKIEPSKTGVTMQSFNRFGIYSGARRSQYLRVGWELLRPGSRRASGSRGQRWHGAGGPGITKQVVYITPEEIKRFGEALGRSGGNGG